jgi:hypothetical protein
MYTNTVSIHLSEHAVEQINRRNIAKDDVLNIIENPTDTTSSFRGRELLRGKIGGKLLEVVIKREDDTIVVITAYYLEE